MVTRSGSIPTRPSRDRHRMPSRDGVQLTQHGLADPRPAGQFVPDLQHPGFYPGRRDRFSTASTSSTGFAVGGRCRGRADQIGLAHLLQRRPEALDQFVRQVGDEATVSARSAGSPRQADGALGGVEGGEQQVLAPRPNRSAGEQGDCRRWCSRPGRWSGRDTSGAASGAGAVRRTYSSSTFSLTMRSAIRRRSSSIWVSPGPPVEPVPPLPLQVGPGPHSRDSHSRAAPVRPAAGLPWSARGGRRSQGSGRCGR